MKMWQKIDVKRWNDAWTALGLKAPRALSFDHLVRHYSEPHRAYHTLQHLDECLAHFDAARNYAEHAAEVEMALWFHDIVYDPMRTDNEELSAVLWAEQAHIAECALIIAERIRRLILATKHNAAPEYNDSCILVDVDLAILGAPKHRFEAYERQIRREYKWMEEAEYKKARQLVLKGFWKRTRIYCTEYFAQQFEEQARANLGSIIDQ